MRDTRPSKADKGILTFGIGFAIFWVFSLLLGLGLLGLIAWAIIRLVLRFT